MQKSFLPWSYNTSLIWVITLLLLPFIYYGHAEIQDFTNCQPAKDRRLASDFVSAYTSRLEAGQTCETNVTSSDQRDVHVLVVNLPDRRHHHDDDDDVDGDDAGRAVVHLDVLSRAHNNLDDPEGTDYQDSQNPVVFVLLSSIPVRWKVTVEGIPSPATGKHLFLIPRGSFMRLRRRHRHRYRPPVKARKRDMPAWSDPRAVWRWAERKFGGVTSFSQIHAPTVKFYTGRDVNADSQCQLMNLSPSHRIFSSHQESKTINGCVSVGRKHHLEKSVYILELREVPKATAEVPDISLEIIDPSSVAEDKLGRTMRDGAVSQGSNPLFYLVVKSPVDLKWSLHSSKMSGWIDIVTDADINLDDLKLSTVALRREDLNRSGQDLVKWSQEYLGDVQMYASVQSANVVQLKIPPKDSSVSPLPGHPLSLIGGNRRRLDQPGKNERAGDWATSDSSTEYFDGIITTKCTSDHMEVAIAKTFIQASEVDKSKITLRDPSCRMSRETSDHVIIRTGLDECGTHLLEMDNLRSYSNKLILWTTQNIVHNLLQDLGSGNFDEDGEDEEAGSGAGRDASPFLDDEDFHSRRLPLDVECKVYKDPREENVDSTSLSLHGGHHNNNNNNDNNNKALTHCNLTLFTNFLFIRPQIKFPMTVTKDEAIYVKAAVTNKDVSLIADACWLSSSHLPHHKASLWKQLVSQGCESSSKLRWHDDPQDAPIGTDLRTTKFSFWLGEEFLGQSLLYLHCQFRTCHRDNAESAEKCSIESQKRCEQVKEHLPGHSSDSSQVACGPLSVGPIELTDREVHIKRPGTLTEATTEKDKTGDGQHQRIIIEGLDSPTVVGIAFAAFIIGIILVGALWFIHSHTGEGATPCCPMKTAVTSQANVNVSGNLTPNSSSPMTA